MTEQLKKCPFCGGKPNKMHEHNNINLDVIVWCECESMRDVDYMRVSEWNTRADGWISAKNNPPLKPCQVIAEWSNGDIEQSSYITDWGKPHFQRKCGTDENGTGWEGNVGHVINWMPLPSPSEK